MPLIWERLAIESPFALVLTGVIVSGLWVSNIVYDHGVPQYISRKIGHGTGGICFLLAPFIFSSVWLPIILASAFTFILVLARCLRPETFRGVGGNGRNDDSFAEIVFAAVAIPVYIIGWWWFKQPALATAALMFMAWGDGVTGLVRSQLYHKPVKGLWGSLAMLMVCLALAWALVKPFWVGAAGAIVAVAVEFSFGDVGFVKRIDDNLAIPLISMGVLIVLKLLV